MTTQDAPLDLQRVLDDLFMVLSQKEKDVVVRRFALDGKNRWTLEKIGQKFGVTRERVRQIEKIALSKLKRTAQSTKLSRISETALMLLNKKGGVATESSLVQEISEKLNCPSDVEKNIIILALSIHPELSRVNKNDLVFAHFHLKSASDKDVQWVVKRATALLERKGDIVSEVKILTDLALQFAQEDVNHTPEFILSALSTDRRIKKIDGGYGLMDWRHINPRSIRDKAFIVLKKHGEPLHFDDLATRIREAGFDKKSVTVQAVHNELIRYDQFVLVGRGLYALKEWGYQTGTVSEIIEALLAKRSPLSKQEIVNGVLKQRHVKKGTISLNLQKNAHFARVGRALYTLDLSKKAA